MKAMTKSIRQPLLFNVLFILLTFTINFNLNAQVCGNDICESGENDTLCIRDCRLDSIYLLNSEGGRVDWSYGSNNLIAYDNNQTGYFQVYTMSPDGSNTVCLTCVNPLFQKHCGNPAWHPSGNWIVFQAEKNAHPGGSSFSTPGRGVYNDLWLTNDTGTVFYQLTNNPVTDSIGSLHPHFSHDGSRLSWCEMYEPSVLWPVGKFFGAFKLKVADFSFDGLGNPVLSNIIEYVPNDSVFYENHGFSPDGNDLLFTTNWNINTIPLGNCNIYKMDLSTLACTQLTSDAYNEHASYSPDGNYIVYGSTLDNANKGMDYWIMKSDGSQKQRLTYFNNSGLYENLNKAFAVDVAWSPDGNAILGFIQDSTLNEEGEIYLVQFSSPLGATISINEQLEANLKRFQIFPNPATEKLNINLFENQESKFQIFNTMGLFVKEFSISQSSQINIADLSSGLYFIHKTNYPQQVQKFIKQ